MNPVLKSIAGKLAYLIGGAQVLLDYEPVKAKVRAFVGGELIEREFNLQMFVVCLEHRRRTYFSAEMPAANLLDYPL